MYKSITKLYLEKFGKLRDYEDPTLLQLSALAAKLALDKVPCVDCSIWGPFGRRLQKLMRFISDVSLEVYSHGARSWGLRIFFETFRKGWTVYKVAALKLSTILSRYSMHKLGTPGFRVSGGSSRCYSH